VKIIWHTIGTNSAIIPLIFNIYLIFKFIYFLIENMTRNNDIIGIFRQNWSFWYSLVVCGVRVMHLVVHGATLKTASSLGGFFFFFYN